MLARVEMTLVADLTFQAEMLKCAPRLRAFAISLTGNIDRADDLTQETLLRAMASAGTFVPGTNMQAWLFVILRNLFYSEYRKRKHEVADIDGQYANSARFSVGGEHDEICRLDYAKVVQCMQQLPLEQREVLALIAEGVAYEDCATILGCAVGTVKSRLSRGREALASMLEGYQLVWHREKVSAEEVEVLGRLEALGVFDDLAWEQ